MNILIIEDNEEKYNQINDSLNRVLESPTTVWMKSRNSGLISIMIRNVERKLKPYDLIICDNYLPLYDIDESDMFESEEDVIPYAADIVREVRERFELVDLPIIVCSSEKIDECDCNYVIRYNPRVSLDESLKAILSDMELYQIMQNDELLFLNDNIIFAECGQGNPDDWDQSYVESLSKKLEEEKSKTSSKTFMSSFMKKLNSGKLKKDTCPQTGKEFTGSEEEIENELKSYQSLLDSGIIEQATKDEQGPVKKLTRK